MKRSRIIKSPLSLDRSLWPALILLLVAAVVPAACVLWFMNEAMNNERLAGHQKLMEAYRSQLAVVGKRIDDFWRDKQKTLMAEQKISPGEAFKKLVTNRIANSVIAHDVSGQVIYPLFNHSQTGKDAIIDNDWLAANDLEFQKHDYLTAANAYAKIAESAIDIDWEARALQSQARCLVKTERKESAIAILMGLISDPKFKDAIDLQGNVFQANAQLYALKLMDDRSSTEFQNTLNSLAQRFSDYRVISMPSSQRCFLMEQLHSIHPEQDKFSTMAAEKLAIQYIECDSNPTFETTLKLTEIADVWQLPSADGRIISLFRDDRILSDLQPLLDAGIFVPVVAVSVFPPDVKFDERKSFLISGAGKFLPGWRLALKLNDSNLLSVTAERRAAVYLWTGVIVAVLTLLISALAARYVSAQMRLAQLKDNLVATVSHELKTPLASIRALVDTLQGGRYRNEEQLLDYLQLITKENQRLSRLIDNFLTFSRMERNGQKFEFKEVRIDSIVHASIDAVRERLESLGCRFELDIASELPTIFGDEDALAAALINLLDNSYKYTGEEKQIILRAYESKGQVCLELMDNGIGVSRRDLRKIFDRFFQADQSLTRSTGGCGLGLSIVRFIIKSHGGTVSVVSQMGKGSTFTISWPIGRSHKKKAAVRGA